MPNLRIFEIQLTHPQVVYFPGQCIQGQLMVELAEDMNMRGIFLMCRGKGNVAWKQGKSHVQASEEYVNVTLKLFGNAPEEGGDVTLNAGNHAFPFQFVLSANIPGSFEGAEQCYVRYSLKATIDRPWKFDKHYKMIFTVGSVLDLNTLQNAAAAVQSNDAKTVCCCMCESSPVTATFRIDKLGYVPGESITFDAVIQDGTGRGINSSVVKLIMLTVYQTHQGKKKQEKREIARLHHGNVDPRGSDEWRRERIRIPPLPPSFLPNCNLIEIHYIFELVVDVAETPFNLTVPLNVVIGTIPLHSVFQQYTSRPQIQPETITNQPQASSSSVNFDLPPPTYRECVLGRVDTTELDEKYAAGNMSYAPSYMYYDFV